MAPSGDGPMAERLRAVLDAQGEGLASIAFAVDDIERAYRRLQRVGLDPEPIVDGESIDRLERRAAPMAPDARVDRRRPMASASS